MLYTLFSENRRGIVGECPYCKGSGVIYGGFSGMDVYPCSCRDRAMNIAKKIEQERK